MASLNKVMIIGNLTKDVELRYTPKGIAVADISLAVNRSWKNDAGEKQEECVFVGVVLWARLAELANEYLTKGSPVFIEGRLQQETWDDKETGKKRSKTKVVGESMQFLGTRPRERDGYGQTEETPPARSAHQPARRPQSTPPSKDNSTPERGSSSRTLIQEAEDLDDDSIPF